MTSTVLTEGEILRLWNAEAPGLRQYFRRALNGDHAAAEDLTAETFTQLARAMADGRVDNAEALLRKIAEARLVDEIRHRQRVTPAGLLVQSEHDEERVSDDLELPRVQVLSHEAAEFQEGFDRAVRALPEPELHAFVLTELRGLSYEEAAAVLGVSRTTVGKRAQLAVDTVRRALLAG